MKHASSVLLGFLGLGLLAVSCGSNGRDPEEALSAIAASSSTQVDPATIEFGPDDVVWQAHTGGGDVPESSRAAEIPSLTIYGDGRIFLSVPGVDRRYDQPVPVLTDRIDPTELARFLATAEGTGLFEPHVDFGEPAEAALPSSRVTIRHRGANLSIDAYGLGARFDVDLSDEQVDNREALRQLLSAAEQLALDPQPWTPDRISVMQLADDAPYVESPEAEADPDAAPPTWPGPALDEILEPTDDGPVLACGELAGPDARRVFNAALENPTPRWDLGGESRTLVLSVVLPGDQPCPGI